MLNIKVWRNPYDTGVNITNPKEIQLEKGLTVLVGCNGVGKTTLLQNIKEYLKEENIPVNLYDNLKEGGMNSIENCLYRGDTEGAALLKALLYSSEGESIKVNIGQQIESYVNYLKTGSMRKSKRLFFDDKDDEDVESKTRVLLFDAIDSGLSVDSVIEIKFVCEQLIKKADEMGVDLYIVISANEYEMARGEACFEVTKGKYIKFDDYEDYRKFILSTRKQKDKRIEREEKYHVKKIEKIKLKCKDVIEKNAIKIENIKSNADEKKRDLTWKEKNDIERLNREIEDKKRELNKYER